MQNQPNNSGVDTELVEFDTYNRSTNDQTSHEKRFAILIKRFTESARNKSFNKAPKRTA